MKTKKYLKIKNTHLYLKSYNKESIEIIDSLNSALIVQDELEVIKDLPEKFRNPNDWELLEMKITSL